MKAEEMLRIFDLLKSLPVIERERKPYPTAAEILLACTLLEKTGSSNAVKKQKKKWNPLYRDTCHLLRSYGWHVEVVEKTEKQKTIFKRDLFGLFDLLAFHSEKVGVIGIQVTTGIISSYETKFKNNPAFASWLKAGNKVIFVQKRVWTEVDFSFSQSEWSLK